jgi:UDP:flavonoid glycosyltransferase YjiC (YdhE family)
VHVAVVAASAPSHIHPHLAVVRELVRRGHRVTYLVGHHLAHLAADTGADVVGCTSVLPGDGGPDHAADAVEDVAAGRW